MDDCCYKVVKRYMVDTYTEKGELFPSNVSNAEK